MFEGALAKLYMLVGAGLLLGYLGSEVRGIIWSGTDSPRGAASSGSGRSGGGGVFFWGSGYRGGK